MSSASLLQPPPQSLSYAHAAHSSLKTLPSFKNRTAAGPTVPPGGLYMTNLWYDEDVL